MGALCLHNVTHIWDPSIIVYMPTRGCLSFFFFFFFLFLHDALSQLGLGHQNETIKTFAKHLGIEINIIDAEQFNSIVYTANKGSEDKVYLLKKNHFDVIKSSTTFYDTPYYFHECKKAYTKRDKHKCPSKCLSCFTYAKDKKCEGNEIICEKCNRKFFGKRGFKNHL